MKKPSELTLTIAKLPFSKLIAQEQGLSELRRSYAEKSADERREAADWVYHEDIADDLFTGGFAQHCYGKMGSNRWPAGIRALAIDPTFAPALLSVGSIEYQLGREEDAMALFLAIPKLAASTIDLEVIIDKAGSFLLDQKDYLNARLFYDVACGIFAESSKLLGGLGYSLAKLGLHDESVLVHRRAVSLEPLNSDLLNDLGWALTESGQYDEAEQVLQRAVELAGPSADRARHNLEEARHRRQNAPSTIS